jgi:peptidoglycan/LPS O-acetylase OafA/YrhL
MSPNPRQGSFDTVRLLAALMVFHSHAFALAGFKEPRMPGSISFGATAVSIFFVISGYLVTTSALSRSVVSYAVARALRVWPGLAVCCAVSILIGAFVTTLPVSDYFSRPETLSYLRNTFVFWTPMQADLPGVFQGRPHTAVNGSLWTLRYEVFCYVLLICAAVLGRRAVLVTAGLMAAFACTILFGRPASAGVTLLDYLEFKWIALLGGAFFFGAVLNWLDRDKLPRLVAVAVFAMALGHRDPILRQILGILLYGSVALWICLSLDLDDRITRRTDLSYGIYIYAFPCQQVAMQFLVSGRSGFVAAYLLSLGATVALAYLSWTWIERPALRYKESVSRRAEAILALRRRWSRARSDSGA